MSEGALVDSIGGNFSATTANTRHPVRVFVVDDDPVFRAGIQAIADDVDTLNVIGEATTDAVTSTMLRRAAIESDVILLGLTGDVGDELHEIRPMVRHNGEPRPRLLVLSTSTDDENVVAAIRAGSSGFLPEGTSRAEIVLGLHVVAGGGAVFGAAVATRLRDYFSSLSDVSYRSTFPDLTDRERQVLDLVARGYPNRRIARELVLSEKTVRNHVSHVFA